MATTPDSTALSTERRHRARRVLLPAVAMGAMAFGLAGCGTGTADPGTSVTPTPASASMLSTTLTAPSPMADPRTAQDVATTFLTAYAGGDTRQACRYATSELQSDLRTETGTGCNTVITMERLPEVTLIDSCAVNGSSSITDQVRFHVVPGAGQYPLLVTGEPQDLVVRLRPATGSFEVTERPTTTDPSLSCEATAP
jgi:hypothetical protein